LAYVYIFGDWLEMILAEAITVFEWLAEISQPLIAAGVLALTGAFFKLASHSSSLVELQQSMDKLHDSVQELSQTFSKHGALLDSLSMRIHDMQEELNKLRDRQHDLSNIVMVLKGKCDDFNS